MDGAPATLALIALPVLGGLGLYASLRLERSESARLAAIGLTAALFGGLLWSGADPGDAEATASSRWIAGRIAGTACIAAAVVVVAARRTLVSALAFLALAAGLAGMLLSEGAEVAATAALVLLAGAVGAPLLALVLRSASPGSENENGVEAEPLLACIAGGLLVAALVGTIDFVFAEETRPVDASPRRRSLPAEWRPTGSAESAGAEGVAADPPGAVVAAIFGGRPMLAEAIAVLFLVTAAGAVLVLRGGGES
ncbi:MAG: hypothetical protein WD069_06935 [Planctomycetales bacterium]